MFHHGATLPALLLGIGALFVWGVDAGDVLRYERTAILDGAVWRLLTGHLVHLNGYHLGWNLAGLTVVWALCGRALPTAAWRRITLLCATGISLCLLVLSPVIAWYEGLSGLLHGWLVAGSIANLMAGLRIDGGVMLAVLTAKLLFEQWHGPLGSSMLMTKGPIVVDAHLYGALSGIMAVWLETNIQKKRSKS